MRTLIVRSRGQGQPEPGLKDQYRSSAQLVSITTPDMDKSNPSGDLTRQVYYDNISSKSDPRPLYHRQFFDMPCVVCTTSACNAQETA